MAACISLRIFGSFLKKANSTRLDDCDAHNVCCLLLLSSFTISFYHRFVTLISIQVFGFAFIICYCFICIDCCLQQSIKITQWSVAGAQQAKGFFLHWGFGPILDIYIYCVAFFSFHLEGSLFFCSLLTPSVYLWRCVRLRECPTYSHS